MDINLEFDPSVATAPAAFKVALTAAADYLDALITDPITVNIAVGWGDPKSAVDNFCSGKDLSFEEDSRH